MQYLIELETVHAAKYSHLGDLHELKDVRRSRSRVSSSRDVETSGDEVGEVFESLHGSGDVLTSRRLVTELGPFTNDGMLMLESLLVESDGWSIEAYCGGDVRCEVVLDSCKELLRRERGEGSVNREDSLVEIGLRIPRRVSARCRESKRRSLTM